MATSAVKHGPRAPSTAHARPRRPEPVRNYLFFLLFLPLQFVSFFRPWIGMLIWGWLSLLNPHRDLYGFACTTNLLV
jgi:hypothetical protein